MSNTLENCKECLADRHESCVNEECLCAVETNHNEPSKESKLVQEFTDKAKQVFPTREEYRELNKEYKSIRKEPIQKEPRKEKWFQCTHCDYSSKSWKAFEQCKKKRHEIITVFLTKEETDEVSQIVDNYKIAEKLMDEYNFITLEGRRNQEILFYKDGIYREFGEQIISKRSRKLAQDVKLSNIYEIKGIIRDETGYVRHDDFDKEDFLLNMKNLLFNFKTGETMEHSPKYLSRVKIPVYYDPDAKCPRFDKFLASSLEEDEEKIQTVLEMMAICLLKDNSLIQKAFMHTGKGSNGKSVLFGILLAMLGKDNVSAKSIHEFESNQFASASLEGKLANICGDVGNKGINTTEVLKKIIGGDPIDCERKFMDGYTFMPYATLIFSANDIPEVNDESDGFARRFELIEWEKSFYGKDRDNSVKTIQKDPSELSGIFNKLIPIARRLMKTHSLTYESTVEDAKQKWLRKSDSTQRFLDDKCSRGEDYSCPVSVIFGNYTKYAKDLGMTPLNDRKFNSKLEKLGLERTVKRINGSSVKVWKGVILSSELKSDNQSSLD